jgi:DNA-binding NarL/FixJ family response regulator
MKARILIVDDHEIVRQGLKSLLANSRPEWEVSGEAGDGKQAIEAARDLKPDVVVLDISMPGMNGLEALSRMRKLGLGCPVLIFTMHESGTLGTDVSRAGAQGYVVKSQAARDLVLAIDTLLAGGTFFGAPPQPETPPPGRGKSAGILFFSDLALDMV